MSVIENAKEIALLVKKVGDIELYRKIVELEGEIIELTHEKRSLEEELSRIKASQDVIKTLTFDAPFYRNAEGNELYCSRCVEAGQMAIHLSRLPQTRAMRYVWVCPQCKAEYLDTRQQSK